MSPSGFDITNQNSAVSESSPPPVMKRAAFYARVSSDKQREEGTIESQIAELKRQIAAAGQVLAKEFIEDGYSGAYLDRPALDALREAVRTDAFDIIY